MHVVLSAHAGCCFTEPFTFEMELDDLPREQLKQMIVDEVHRFHQQRQQLEQLA
jgi:hypothetical protein